MQWKTGTLRNERRSRWSATSSARLPMSLSNQRAGDVTLHLDCIVPAKSVGKMRHFVVTTSDTT